jgi:hypothetical protein
LKIVRVDGRHWGQSVSSEGMAASAAASSLWHFAVEQKKKNDQKSSKTVTRQDVQF